MTPLHRRAEAALTELARADCLAVQGHTGGALAARIRAAREEIEAVLHAAGVILPSQARPHWLDQPEAPQQAGIISLADAKARRDMGAWR
jgi:hypothetical protein